MSEGSLVRALHPRPCAVCVVAAVGKTATPDGVIDSLCFLDTQGKGTNTGHEVSCPDVDYAGNDGRPEGSLCTNIMRLILSKKGLSLKLKLALK